MDTQPPLDNLAWGSPSAPAELFRALRSFDEPKGISVEQPNWDGAFYDSNWPGFLAHFQEKNYDASKVGTNIWDPVLDKNMILDSRVEDTEECQYFKGSFD